MKRLTKGIVVLALASVAGCAGGGCASGDDANDLDAFCGRFTEFEDSVVIGVGDDVVLDGLRDLREVAPADVRADLDSTIDAYATMQDFSDRIDAGEEVDDRDPELVEASARLDQGGSNLTAYVGANCTLPPGS